MRTGWFITSLLLLYENASVHSLYLFPSYIKLNHFSQLQKLQHGEDIHDCSYNPDFPFAWYCKNAIHL